MRDFVRNPTALFVLLLCGPLAAERPQGHQEPRTSRDGGTGSRPVPESAPASRAASPGDPAAKAFLLEAGRRRAPGGEEAIRDVTIQFEAESNRGGVHNETAEATHRFLRPGRIRTRLVAAGSTIERGFDGKQYWLRRGDRVEILAGRDYEKDRSEIEYSVRFTEHLLQLTSLASLAEKMRELERLTPEVLDPKGSAEPSPGVRGVLEAFPSLRAGGLRRVIAELRFDAATRDLLQVRVRLVGSDGRADEESETLLFSDHRVVKGKGVRFPHRVVAYTANRQIPEYKFQILSVSWNDGLDEGIFAPGP